MGLESIIAVENVSGVCQLRGSVRPTSRSSFVIPPGEARALFHELARPSGSPSTDYSKNWLYTPSNQGKLRSMGLLQGINWSALHPIVITPNETIFDL